jgi:nucleoside-diphosphate-sugar epimerase
MTTHLLVVGGNGFIGSHIVQRALNMGWKVSSLGLTGNCPPGAIGIAADIGNAESLRTAMVGMRFEYVVNCGGYIDHAPFASGGRRLIESHFDGVLNLVESIDRRTLRRFINIGSSDEYGGAVAPQSEDIREAPISPYSLAKVASTHFLQMMHRTEGFPAVTLRLFLTYGPGQDQRRFLPQIIRSCLEGRSFPTSGGEQLRDFCYIDDTVQAVFAAMQAEAADGEVINVASGKGVLIRSMIETVCRMIGSGTPQFGVIPYRNGENMALYADISKITSKYGWSPSVSLNEGLLRTISAYRSCSDQSHR